MEPNGIDLREEFYQDVHNMNPAWWMKWGIGIIFLIFFLLFMLSSYIKYPDVVTAEARMLSNSPSVKIPAQITAGISSLIASNGDHVDLGEYLLVFQNTANDQDVSVVKQKILSLKEHQNFVEFFQNEKDNSYRLGEVQSSWEILLKRLFDYYQIVKLNKYDDKIARLTRELKILRKSNAHLKKIVDIGQDVKELLTSNKQVDSVLHQEKVMSAVEYNRKYINYLAEEKVIERERLTYHQNKLEMVRINNTIKELQQNKQESLLSVSLQIQEALTNLQLSIKSWEEKYVIKPPVAGTVNYLVPLKHYHYVTRGEALVVITPESKQYTAQLKIPFSGAGKIKKGQKVNIKLDDYPYNEFGFLEGTMDKMSEVANQDHYLGEVKLKNKNTTSYNKVIAINENAKGTAEIITNDRSLLSRIFEKILYIFIR